MSPSEEYDWQVSKYIPEDSPEQYSIDDLLHDLKMTTAIPAHSLVTYSLSCQEYDL
jgi:hypothetical protein